MIAPVNIVATLIAVVCCLGALSFLADRIGSALDRRTKGAGRRFHIASLALAALTVTGALALGITAAIGAA